MSRLDDAVFEAGARHHRETAIDDGAARITYDELLSRADDLAGRVRRACPAPRVGLRADRSAAGYLAYLAILRAGKTVVPLGDAPDRRSADVAADAGLTHAVNARDTYEPELVTLAGAGDGGPAADPRHAYILFTSGSTGRPKGIPIRHSNVLAYLGHVVPRYAIGPGARLTATFSLTFDLSVHDLFAAWTSGATLVLPRGREYLMPSAYVAGRAVTHWFSVPSAIRAGGRLGGLRPGSMPGLRWSLFCGEQLTLGDARQWAAAAPGSVLENLYGPTELTIACAQYRLPRDPAAWPRTPNGTVPIGDTYPHLRSRIGAGGELLVAGPQRFGGYLDPTLNQGRFLDDHGRPIPASPQAWYATGDRVSGEDGELVHLGRVDRQVKVNGFRIELAEVEHLLRGFPDITAAHAAVLRGDGGVRLAAAVETTHPYDPAGLTRQMRKDIPSHLVPARLLVLDRFPLSPNGKVDGAEIGRLLQAAANRSS